LLAATRTAVPGTRAESERITAPLMACPEDLPVRAAPPAPGPSRSWFERSAMTRVHGPPLFLANCALLN
jgi:hypothetical protein